MNPRTQFPFGNGQTQLELNHPHIVERLRMLWGHPEGMTFLSGLLVDNRGGRKGFTREVFTELAALLRPVPAGVHRGARHPGGGLGLAGTRRGICRFA